MGGSGPQSCPRTATGSFDEFPGPERVDLHIPMIEHLVEMLDTDAMIGR